MGSISVLLRLAREPIHILTKGLVGKITIFLKQPPRLHLMCNSLCPIFRFRLYGLCSDETGTIPIVWPDDEICRLTGSTVYDVDAHEDDVRLICYYGITNYISLYYRR